MEWILQLDKQIFLAINGWHNELWDGITCWISGKTTWWPFYVLLLAYMAWTKRWQLFPMLLFIILVITLADQTSVHLFKNVFQRLRPCHEPALEGLVHIVNNKCGGQFGFISSHAANTAGVAFLSLLWIRKRWFTVLMVTWALLVGYSRIYLGVHYPGDIIGGAILGVCIGFLIGKSYKLIRQRIIVT